MADKKVKKEFKAVIRVMSGKSSGYGTTVSEAVDEAAIEFIMGWSHLFGTRDAIGKGEVVADIYRLFEDEEYFFMGESQIVPEYMANVTIK